MIRTAPAGWYPCPESAAQLRYFDGTSWTTHTAPAAPETVDVPAQDDPAASAAPEPQAAAPAAPGVMWEPQAEPVPDAYEEPYVMPGTKRYGTAIRPTAVSPRPVAPAPQPRATVAAAVPDAVGGPSALAGGPVFRPYAPEPRGRGASPRDPMHWVVPTGRSGASIAAGYVGLVALLVWPLGPVAIGLGIRGLHLARTGGHGRGRSVFGIVTGLLATAAGVLVGTLLLLGDSLGGSLG